MTAAGRDDKRGWQDKRSLRKSFKSLKLAADILSAEAAAAAAVNAASRPSFFDSPMTSFLPTSNPFPSAAAPTAMLGGGHSPGMRDEGLPGCASSRWSLDYNSKLHRDGLLRPQQYNGGDIGLDHDHDHDQDLEEYEEGQALYAGPPAPGHTTATATAGNSSERCGGADGSAAPQPVMTRQSAARHTPAAQRGGMVKKKKGKYRRASVDAAAGAEMMISRIASTNPIAPATARCADGAGAARTGPIPFAGEDATAGISMPLSAPFRCIQDAPGHDGGDDGLEHDSTVPLSFGKDIAAARTAARLAALDAAEELRYDDGSDDGGGGGDRGGSGGGGGTLSKRHTMGRPKSVNVGSRSIRNRRRSVRQDGGGRGHSVSSGGKGSNGGVAAAAAAAAASDDGRRVTGGGSALRAAWRALAGFASRAVSSLAGSGAASDGDDIGEDDEPMPVTRSRDSRALHRRRMGIDTRPRSGLRKIFMLGGTQHASVAPAPPLMPLSGVAAAAMMARQGSVASSSGVLDEAGSAVAMAAMAFASAASAPSSTGHALAGGGGRAAAVSRAAAAAAAAAAQYDDDGCVVGGASAWAVFATSPTQCPLGGGPSRKVRIMCPSPTLTPAAPTTSHAGTAAGAASPATATAAAAAVVPFGQGDAAILLGNSPSKLRGGGVGCGGGGIDSSVQSFSAIAFQPPASGVAAAAAAAAAAVSELPATADLYRLPTTPPQGDEAPRPKGAATEVQPAAAVA